MTKTQQIELLRNALKELMENSTFSAYAGDNCRQCPRAHDGGCNDPHDEDCPYGMAMKAAESALEQTVPENSMDYTDQAMRILAVLMAGAGELRIPVESLQKIGSGVHLDCSQDGPVVVLRVRVDEKKAETRD